MSSLRSFQLLARTVGSFYSSQGPSTSRFIPNIVSSQHISKELCPPRTALSILDSFLWFAVPKKKVTRHKKRLKTTVQKRIGLNKNIIVDPRTGEVTLQHKMPANWREYLPEV